METITRRFQLLLLLVTGLAALAPMAFAFSCLSVSPGVQGHASEEVRWLSPAADSGRAPTAGARSVPGRAAHAFLAPGLAASGGLAAVVLLGGMWLVRRSVAEAFAPLRQTAARLDPRPDGGAAAGDDEIAAIGRGVERLQAEVVRLRHASREESHYVETFDRSPLPLVLFNDGLTVLAVNRAFCEEFNTARESIAGRSLEDVVSGGDVIRAARTLASGRGRQSEVTARLGPKGRSDLRRMTASLVRVRDGAEGEAEGLLLLGLRSVADRDRLQASLQSSEQRFRDLVGSLDAVVWEAAPSCDESVCARQFTFVSERAADMLGYPAERWMATPGFWGSVIHHDDRERVFAVSRDALGASRHHEMEYRIVRPDGSAVWVRDAVRVMRAGPEGTVQARGVMVDVTERKREEELRTRLSSAVEQAAEAVMMTDAQGRIIYVNPAFETVTGYASAEVMGKNPRFLKSPAQDPAVHAAIWQTILAGKVWRGEVTNRRKDGALYTWEETITPVRDERGTITYFISIGQDVSRRHQLEAQLRQATKMEAVGRLAGGVAHDFNNLLTVITGYSEQLLAALTAADPLRSGAEAINRAADRAAALTQQLLAFSRRQMRAPKVIDLNGVVVGMNKMLRRMIGEDVELITVPARDLWPVKADPNQIEQIIMNLAVNARDAMPEGGSLMIETSNVTLDQAYLSRHLAGAPGPYVMLAVSDTGCGMDAETQAHLFEPFFTTKAVGKGTGLGLSTVYGIVKQNNGYIWVYSEPDRGTSFKIYLPRAEECPEPASVDAGVQHAPRGSETVLIVEDDDAVRQLLRDVLQRHGYAVLEASDGGQALLFCERYTGPVHLLVTDVVMPQMNGCEVAERLSRVRPQMKILYISGYTDHAVTQQSALEAGTAFLPKPFTPATLAKKVRDVLGPAVN